MLYIIPLEIIYLINKCLHSFDQHFSISPIPLLLATTILLLVSMSSMFLDSTYKWDHTVFFFLWFISLRTIQANILFSRHYSCCVKLTHNSVHWRLKMIHLIYRVEFGIRQVCFSPSCGIITIISLKNLIYEITSMWSISFRFTEFCSCMARWELYPN